MTLNQQQTGMAEHQSNKWKFIVFKVGEIYYGAPLLSMREVLEYQEPKCMPNMVKYFMGVINVRGAIVGVIDLRTKFSAPELKNRKVAMLLCDTDVGPLAAIVDSVEYVVQLNQEDMEQKPPVQSKIQHQYLIGIAKHKNELLTILDLHKALCDEQLKNDHSSQRSAAAA